MDADKRRNPDTSGNSPGQRTTADESGLSFEAEPTGIEESTESHEGVDSDPGRSSPSAAFTPGPPANARAPFWTPAVAVLIVVLIALAAAAIWFL